VAGFVLREKYCWLVADKPNEKKENLSRSTIAYGNQQGAKNVFSSWR
jgi:hypothetical protein